MFVQHLIQHHVHTEVCANPHMLRYQFAFVCCSYMLTLVPTIVATAAVAFIGVLEIERGRWLQANASHPTPDTM